MLLRTYAQNDNLNEKDGSKTKKKEKLCIKSITEKLFLCNSSGLVHKRLCIFKILYQIILDLQTKPNPYSLKN